MNIILTGASRGIGYQTALKLCENEINNLLLISRNESALIKLKEECNKINNSVKITLIAEDLSVLTHREKNFLDQIRWTNCDVLINNAGYLVNKPFLEMLEEDMLRMFEINVQAPSRIVRLAYHLLVKSSSAHVLNIGSMGGFQGSSKFAGLNYYSASKAALANLTECLAEEFKETNIRFNCLALGAVQTEMLNEAFPGFKAPTSAKEMGGYIAEFALNGHKYYNSKILPVTLSTP